MADWYTLDPVAANPNQPKYTPSQGLLDRLTGGLVGAAQDAVAKAPTGGSTGGTAPTPSTGGSTGTTTPVIPDYLIQMFAAYGLQSLATWYIARVRDGATDAEIANEIYDQPAYKQRFPAMAALRSKGHTISEAEYISVEKSYKDSLAAWGLAGTVYDTNGMYAQLMESEVSVRELEERLSDAKMVVDSTDPNVKQALLANYGISSSDLVVYALDPKGRGKDYVERLARSATLQGIAKSFSLDMNRVYAEQLAMDSAFKNSTEADYRDALSTVADVKSAQSRLAALEGDKFDAQDAADTVIKKDANKVLASRMRAQREQARFSGTSGLTSNSLRRGSI